MDDETEAHDEGQNEEGDEGVQGAGVCAAIRADGSACRARRLPNSLYCWAHAPHTQAKAQAARSVGGTNRANAARTEKSLPRDLRPLLPLLVKAILDVRDGALEPSRLSSMAVGVGAIVRLFSAVDSDELRARVDALEARKEGGTDAS